MSYNPNLPNPNDLLSNSQGDIKLNFQQLESVYGENHYPYSNATSDKGKHKKVVMPINTPPTTAVGEGTLYVTDQAGVSSPQLAYRLENKTGVYSNGVKDIPLSLLAPISMGVFDAVGGSLGYQYNNAGCVRNSDGVFTISGLPSITSNYAVIITPQYTGSGTTNNLVTCRINTKTASSFQVVFTFRAGGSNQFFDPDSFSYVMFGGYV